MPNYWRELDITIERLTDFLIETRSRPRSSLSPEQRNEFKEVVERIEHFTSPVGLFVTDDLELVQGVFEEILDGYRAYVMSRLWTGIPRLLFQVSRYTRNHGLTPSGKLFVEMRKRIAVALKAGAGRKNGEGTFEMGKELRRYLFGGLFTRSQCSLLNPSNRARRRNAAILSCTRGCDLGLLAQYNFHPEIIARIAGLKKDTTENRWLACQDCVRKRVLEQETIPMAAPTHAQLTNK